jgi:hypothetical protein
MDTQTLDLVTVVEETLKDWHDHRLCSKDELVAAIWYLVYGQNAFSQFGADWTGCSFSQSEETCLLVGRRVFQGDAQVCFVTGRTPMDCMRILHKRYEKDTLNWSKDKFR